MRRRGSSHYHISEATVPAGINLKRSPLIKGIRNLQEGRHALAQEIFHGRMGELYQRCHEGMEDQLGALGLVLNCVVLWNTVYIDAALDRLRASGHPVEDEDD